MTTRLDREIAAMQKAQLPWQPPTDSELRAQRLEYLKQCRPKTLRELKKAGELDKHLTDKAAAAKDCAEGLMLSGEFDQQAWSRAIRSEILDSESD